MSQTYYAILTAIGEAKLANAAALNTTLKLAKMAVGDGGGVVPTPNRSQTALVGEWYRAGLNTLAVDPSNTSQIIAELVIPEATGGNWIREMGLIDADGNLIAVANTPPSYKPQLAEGSGRTQVLRMVLIVSSASAVELKIDPSVVLATRQYVDDAITVAVNRLDNKQSVRVATTANLPLTGTPTVDGVALAVGDRILVKNQDTASQNGLYLVAAGTWNRALDADASSEVTPGLTVYVEQGASQGDTIWKLITDAPITLGNTALAFADITSGYAPLKSPAFTDKPSAPTASRFDSSKQLANTEALKQRGLEFATVKDVTAEGTVLLPEDAGAVIRVNLAATGAVVLPALASLPIAAAMLIKNVSESISMTVSAAGADTLPRPVTLPPLCSALLVARPGATAWLLVGGAAEVFGNIRSNVIGQLGLRNRLINGNFAFWQRGVSFSLSNETRFVADRFIAYTGAGGACSVVKNIHAVGRQLGGQYLTWNQTKAATTSPLLTQRVESVRSLEGRKATLSLTASASAPLACQVQIRQSFGSGGSPSAMVETIVGAFTVPGDNVSARQEIVFDVPSISGKTIGTNADDFLEVMLLMPAAATFALNTWDWQLEEGALTTPFEVRPLALELQLCQRYFEKSYDPDIAPGTLTTAGAECIPAINAGWFGTYIRLKVPKRVPPSIVTYSTSVAGSSQAWNQTNSAECSGTGVGDNSRNGFTINLTPPSNTTAQALLRYQWTCNSEL